MKNTLLSFIVLFSIQSFSQTVFNWGIDKDLYYHYRVAKEFKSNIEAKTQKRVIINLDLFEAAEDTGSAIQQIESGKFQIAQSLTGHFETFSPLVKVWEIPFLFSDFEHAEKYVNSKNAQQIVQLIDNKNIQAIDYTYSGGPVFIFSEEKVNSFDSLAKKPFMLADETSFAKEFFEPRGIIGKHDSNLKNLVNGEVLGAGAEFVYSLPKASSAWINITNHRMISRIVCVSKQALNKLSTDDKNIFLKELKRFMVEERKLSMEGYRIVQQLLLNRGTNVSVWDKDRKESEFKKFGFSENKYKTLLGEINFIRQLDNKSLRTAASNEGK